MMKFVKEVVRPTSFEPNPNMSDRHRALRKIFPGAIGALDGSLVHAVVPINEQTAYRERGGLASHVPTVDVSVVDLTARLEKPASFDDINQDYAVIRWYRAPELCKSFYSEERQRRWYQEACLKCGKKLLRNQLDQVYFGKTKERVCTLRPPSELLSMTLHDIRNNLSKAPAKTFKLFIVFQLHIAMFEYIDVDVN
nr:hypothetical protein [Tanacetum cinerariifolium]